MWWLMLYLGSMRNEGSYFPYLYIVYWMKEVYQEWLVDAKICTFHQLQADPHAH
jgi:hypothetical protein